MISEGAICTRFGHPLHPLRGAAAAWAKEPHPGHPGNLAGFVLSLNRFALEVTAPETLARTTVLCAVLHDWASRRRHERDPSTRRAQRGPQVHNDKQCFCQANRNRNCNIGI